MAIDPAVLRGVPVFQFLDEDEIRELLAEVEERSYVAGQTIFKEGQAGGDMHVVLEGKVETFLVDDEGHRVVLAELGRGEMFGELSLFDNEPRSASAAALVPTRTGLVDREGLERLFAKKPPAALDIMAVLSRRLRRTDHLLSKRVAKNPNTVIEEELTLGDRLADGVARFGGSWKFISAFMLMMLGWMALNLFFLIRPFDPAPFIGLNLVLSMLAALQAPVIMMSQNRQDAKDRVRADLDYQVNLKSEARDHAAAPEGGSDEGPDPGASWWRSGTGGGRPSVVGCPWGGSVKRSGVIRRMGQGSLALAASAAVALAGPAAPAPPGFPPARKECSWTSWCATSRARSCATSPPTRSWSTRTAARRRSSPSSAPRRAPPPPEEKPKTRPRSLPAPSWPSSSTV